MGNFGGIGRVLVKVPECLKKDFRLSRVQNTPRFLVLFWRVLVRICLLFSKIFYIPNSFCAAWEKFSCVFSRCWHFFLGCRWGVFEFISRVLNTPRILRVLNTPRILRGCHWDGQFICRGRAYAPDERSVGLEPIRDRVLKFYVFLLDRGEKNANVLCRMGGYKGGVYHGGRYKQRYAFCNKYLTIPINE